MTDATEPAVVAGAAVTSAAPLATTFKVRIDAGGREIELETTHATANMDAIAATALALWKATDDAQQPSEARGLFGLVVSDRAPERAPSSTLTVPMDVPQ